MRQRAFKVCWRVLFAPTLCGSWRGVLSGASAVTSPGWVPPEGHAHSQTLTTGVPQSIPGNKLSTWLFCFAAVTGRKRQALSGLPCLCAMFDLDGHHLCALPILNLHTFQGVGVLGMMNCVLLLSGRLPLINGWGLLTGAMQVSNGSQRTVTRMACQDKV